MSFFFNKTTEKQTQQRVFNSNNGSSISMLEDIAKDVLQHGIFSRLRTLNIVLWQVVKRDTDCGVVQKLSESRWRSDMGRWISHSVDYGSWHHRFWYRRAKRSIVIGQEWHLDLGSCLFDTKILSSWDYNASIEWVVIRRDAVSSFGGEFGSLSSWEWSRWSQIFGKGSYLKSIAASNSLVQLISKTGGVKLFLLVDVSDILLVYWSMRLVFCLRAKNWGARCLCGRGDVSCLRPKCSPRICEYQAGGSVHRKREGLQRVVVVG